MLEFVLAVKATHREINQRFSEIVRPLGTTVVQAEAVLLLAESEPLSLKELGTRLVVEAGNPSRLVDRLVTAGLVRRMTATGDRRQVQLALTDQGRRLAARINQARQPLRDWSRQALDGNGVRQATTVLNHVLEQLQQVTCVTSQGCAGQPPSCVCSPGAPDPARARGPDQIPDVDSSNDPEEV